MCVALLASRSCPAGGSTSSATGGMCVSSTTTRRRASLPSTTWGTMRSTPPPRGTQNTFKVTPQHRFWAAVDPLLVSVLPATPPNLCKRIFHLLPSPPAAPPSAQKPFPPFQKPQSSKSSHRISSRCLNASPRRCLKCEVCRNGCLTNKNHTSSIPFQDSSH